VLEAVAATIHRSQGSEYPAVVIPLTTGAWMMLRRNLLYTAITRAKRLVVLVGSRRVLAAAVRTPRAGRRHTGLTHRLSQLLGGYRRYLLVSQITSAWNGSRREISGQSGSSRHCPAATGLAA
jgi:hypothetical protein